MTYHGEIVLLDNQDSFTYNLVDELAQLGYTLTVYRNTVDVAVIEAHLARAVLQGPVLLCLSPGPGHPKSSGNLMDVIAMATGRYPVLGVCLGFQALIEFFGGIVDRCVETVHGKSSLIECTEHTIFTGLTKPLRVARYHSLQATEVPPSVTIIAETKGIPMAFEHKEMRAIGFQFHPESIMTSEGSQLLQQTIDYLCATTPALTDVPEAPCANS